MDAESGPTKKAQVPRPAGRRRARGALRAGGNELESSSIGSGEVSARTAPSGIELLTRNEMRSAARARSSALFFLLVLQEDREPRMGPLVRRRGPLAAAVLQPSF